MRRQRRLEQDLLAVRRAVEDPGPCAEVQEPPGTEAESLRPSSYLVPTILDLVRSTEAT